MRQDLRQRTKALAGLRAISGQNRMLGTLVRVISSGKQALDAMMLEMGRMVAESVMLIEREEVTEPDDYPTDPDLQKWAHSGNFNEHIDNDRLPVNDIEKSTGIESWSDVARPSCIPSGAECELTGNGL